METDYLSVPHQHLTSQVQKYSYVDANGCFIWTGPNCGDNYGRTHYKGIAYSITKLYWVWVRGEVPQSRLIRKCKSPSCFNPDHMSIRSKEDEYLENSLLEEPDPVITEALRAVGYPL